MAAGPDLGQLHSLSAIDPPLTFTTISLKSAIPEKLRCTSSISPRCAPRRVGSGSSTITLSKNLSTAGRSVAIVASASLYFRSSRSFATCPASSFGSLPQIDRLQRRLTELRLRRLIALLLRLAQDVLDALERRGNRDKILRPARRCQRLSARDSVAHVVGAHGQHGIDHVVGKAAHVLEIELQPLAQEGQISSCCRTHRDRFSFRLILSEER